MRKLKDIISLISALSLVLITVLIFIAVIFRYLFNSPILFSFELSTLIFAWLIYVGAYLAEDERSHIGFDLVIKRIPGKIRVLVSYAVEIIAVFILITVIFYGFRITMISGIRLTAMDISIKFLYLSCPVGLSFVLLRRLLGLILRK